MLPRSVFNLLLLAAVLILLRALLFLQLGLQPETTELLSILGVSASATLAYRLVSQQAREWLAAKAEAVLASRSFSSLLYVIAAGAILPSTLLAREIYTWRGPGTLVVERNGKELSLTGIETEDGALTVSRVVLAWLPAEVNSRAWSTAYRPKPLSPQLVPIPFYASTDPTAKTTEIEDLLSLVFFQWRRDQLLDEADVEIHSDAPSEVLRLEERERLDSLWKIVTLIFDERAHEDPRRLARLLERYRVRYPNDSWLPLLNAGELYAAGSFAEAASLLESTAGTPGISPRREVLQFFRSLCLLQEGRAKANQGGELAPEIVTRSIDLLKSVEGQLAKDESVFAAVAYPSSLIYQGIVHFYAKNWAHARAAFERAAEHGSGILRARAKNGLGYIQFIRGDLAGAERELIGALDVSADFIVARLNLGYVALARGEYEKAEEIFAMVRDSWHGDPAHRYNTLALLGLAHALEASDAEPGAVVAAYASALRTRAINDYSEIKPEPVRMAFMLKAAGERIYRDRRYFGLEVLALTMFARATDYIEGAEEPSDLLEALRKQLSTNARQIREGVHEAWLYSGTLDPFFSAIRRVA